MSFSGTRGEGFGKLNVKVLLTRGYSGGKCAAVCLVLQYVLCISGPVVYKHDKDGSLLKNVLELYSARGREQKTKQNCKFLFENLFNLFKGFQC